jgi:hypothetical protein
LLNKVRELVQRCFDALRDVGQSRVEVGRVSFDRSQHDGSIYLVVLIKSIKSSISKHLKKPTSKNPCNLLQMREKLINGTKPSRTPVFYNSK